MKLFTSIEDIQNQLNMNIGRIEQQVIKNQLANE